MKSHVVGYEVLKFLGDQADAFTPWSLYGYYAKIAYTQNGGYWPHLDCPLYAGRVREHKVLALAGHNCSPTLGADSTEILESKGLTVC